MSNLGMILALPPVKASDGVGDGVWDGVGLAVRDIFPYRWVP